MSVRMSIADMSKLFSVVLLLDGGWFKVGAPVRITVFLKFDIHNPKCIVSHSKYISRNDSDVCASFIVDRV
jgi:hypothetical protein